MGFDIKQRAHNLVRLNFVKAQYPDAHSEDPLKLGLEPLNDPIKTDSELQGMRRNHGKAGPSNKPNTTRELFKESNLDMNWTDSQRLGAGLYNLGNTCFMNSVLQCLLHTPPLAKLLLSNQSLVINKDANAFDPIRMTKDLLIDSHSSRRGYVEPRAHARSLRKISRSFRVGRQEDAHEYLIALLDAMHERSLAGMNPKPHPDVEMTSFIYRIFGGKIRSQIKCQSCNYESNTYDPFLDLSLEITHANSVEKALQRFTTGEILDGSNKYRCPKENRQVRAIKRMNVETAPNVLVIQLKRFEFSLSGRKISKAVEFRETLDLTPFMSKKPAVPAVYDLYGVLVHQGHSMHSGHYFCFIKGAIGGDWHKFDDTRVSLSNVRNVLGQHPYMLFYIKRQPKLVVERPLAKPQAAPAKTKAATVEKKPQPQVELANGLAGKKRRRELEAAVPTVAPAPVANGKQKRQPAKPEPSESEDDYDSDEQNMDGVRVFELRRRNNMMSRTPTRTFSKSGKRFQQVRDLHLLVNNSRLASGSPLPATSAARPESPEIVPFKRRKKKTAVPAPPPVADTDSDSMYGSALEAPDWPPEETKPLANGVGRRRETNGKGSKGKAAAKQLLRGPVAEVDGWDGEKRSGRSLDLKVNQGKRKQLDDYDAEYDKGKTKKVRGQKAGDNLESKDFDKAFKTKQRSDNKRSSTGSNHSRGSSGNRGRGGRGFGGRGRGDRRQSGGQKRY